MMSRTKVGEQIAPLKPDDDAIGRICWQCGGKFGVGSLTTMVYVMSYEPFAVHVGCIKNTVAKLEGYPVEEGTDMFDAEDDAAD